MRILEYVIEYSLLFAMFFLALSPLAMTVFLTISGAAYLLKLVWTRGGCFKRTPFDKAALAFVLLSGASVVASPDRAFSAYNFTCLMGLYAAAYYVTVQNISTMTQLKRLLVALAVAAILSIGYGYYQFFHGIDVSQMRWVDGEQFPELKTRVFSTMQNPNLFAGYLLTVLSLAFGVFCKANGVRLKLFLTLLFLAAALCLGMTYCRGAWLSFAIVTAMYTLRYKRWVFFALIAVSSLLVWNELSVQQRLLSSFTVGDTSSEMRLAMWESTLAMTMDHPLLGIGWGAYWMVYPLYDFYINDPSVRIVHAHNMYLNYMAETGLLGFSAFLVLLLGHLRLALASVSLRSSPLLNGVVFGIALSIFCVMLNGLTDYVLFNIELSVLFWFLNGVVVAICRGGLK